MDTQDRPEGIGVAQWVFDSLKDEIIQGRIAPGEFLVEGTLASRFTVSRGPAREALQRLSQAGLVKAMPRVGYQVTHVNARDFEEVFVMRLLLEPEATRLATRRIAAKQCSIARLDALAQAGYELRDAPPENFATRVLALNHEFHLHIAELSNVRRIESAVDTLLDDLSRVMHLLASSPDLLDPVYDDHPDLVKVMAAGDADGAAELMTQSLEQTRAQMRPLVVGAELGIAGD
ncbi:GntR family transcriptional regulator [Microbacterium soli]|uniref:GntR family transcriptional regulator n=1 Tax=Microbacterium soli TaxID=446075 RepID=A0ABP7NCX0_9MICO